ncbi:hypothetical protein [Actinophytocola algeriensis]|uniref:Uncharacterized protein n=1 Tax=Actinophytocola algeriensis TaxID=1768010 RepID=A0A7W7QDD9_9PSEU|nr:hypothetical protein [Actinophytocola algeriensis]MBB4911500.1 hypothetical protein [Actinophytocola algeriensis]MBE1473512.1 hypothetical protein [Actinophytocola algeriensis]
MEQFEQVGTLLVVHRQQHAEHASAAQVQQGEVEVWEALADPGEVLVVDGAPEM